MNYINKDFKESLDFFKLVSDELYKTNQGVKLISIGDIKIKNSITKSNIIAKNLYFFAEGGSGSVYFVQSITNMTDGSVYKIHSDLNHMNIENDTSTYIRTLKIGDQTLKLIFEVRRFCNPVIGNSLYNNPDDYSKLLKGYLLSQNGEDRYRSIYYIDVDSWFPPITSRSSGNIIRARELTPLTASARLKPEELKVPARMGEAVREFDRAKISMDDDSLFAYCNSGSIVAYRIITKQDLEEFRKNPYTTSLKICEDYPIFTKDDFDNIGELEIPLVDKSCLFVGLGSANSGIITSLGRSTYIGTDITLIDFDRVETKNLRNQLYTKYSCGRYKVDAMKDIITKMIVDTISVKPYYEKFQKVNLEYDKYKYIFCGLDSIEARQELFDSIMDKKIKGHYLIDTRYIDQESSLYFIDLTNLDEVKYYKTNLDADAELLSKVEQPKRFLTDAEKHTYMNRMISGECRYLATTLIRPWLDDQTLKTSIGNMCVGSRVADHAGLRCGSPECKEFLRSCLDKVKVPEESTCVKQNIIGIYNFTGAYVYQLIKELETKNKKLATHVELACDTIPQAMVVRK